MSVYFLGGKEDIVLKDAMYDKLFSKLENPPERAALDSYSVSNLFILAAQASGWPLPVTLQPTESHYLYQEPTRANLPKEMGLHHKKQRDTLQVLDHLLNEETREKGSVSHDQYGDHRYGNTGFISVPQDIVDPMLDWMSTRLGGKQITLRPLTGEKVLPVKNQMVKDYYEKYSEGLKHLLFQALQIDAKQFENRDFVDVLSEIGHQTQDALNAAGYDKAKTLPELVARHSLDAPLDRPDAAKSQAVGGALASLKRKMRFIFEDEKTFVLSDMRASMQPHNVLSAHDLNQIGNAIREAVPNALAGYEKRQMEAAAPVAALPVEETPKRKIPIKKKNTELTEEKQILVQERRGITLTLIQEVPKQPVTKGQPAPYRLMLKDQDGKEIAKSFDAPGNINATRNVLDLGEWLDNPANIAGVQTASVKFDAILAEGRKTGRG